MEKYILNKLKDLKEQELVSFHVPGHKIGKIFNRLGYEEVLKEIYKLDTTEIEGTDNLHTNTILTFFLMFVNAFSNIFLI